MFKTAVRWAHQSYLIFKENHPIKFASAIAYFSLFALPSMFLIMIVLLGAVFGRAVIRVELRAQLAQVIGNDGAKILDIITRNFEDQASQSIWMTLAYMVTTFWLSTQFFRLFQNALNDLWRIKPKFDSFWKKLMMERLLSFLLVLSAGVVFFSSLVLGRAIELASIRIFDDGFLDKAKIKVIVNVLVGLLIWGWFALLYKVLPFVRIKWGPTLVGSAVTTIFFFLGVWVLWGGVVNRDLKDIYDQAASIILVALWMFYSAFIFLFGAAFTRVYAREQDKRIAPASYAYKFKIVRDDEYDEEDLER